LILRRAQRWHHIQLPKFPHYDEEQSARKAVVVTPEEEQSYTAAAPEDLQLLTKIMIDTAAEDGVVASLKWLDVIFDQTQIHKHGKIHIRGTKTKYRDRFVPMRAELRSLLLQRIFLLRGGTIEAAMAGLARVLRQ
jgi:integrase